MLHSVCGMLLFNHLATLSILPSMLSNILIVSFNVWDCKEYCNEAACQVWWNKVNQRSRHQTTRHQHNCSHVSNMNQSGGKVNRCRYRRTHYARVVLCYFIENTLSLLKSVKCIRCRKSQSGCLCGNECTCLCNSPHASD